MACIENNQSLVSYSLLLVSLDKHNSHIQCGIILSFSFIFGISVSHIRKHCLPKSHEDAYYFLETFLPSILHFAWFLFLYYVDNAL